MSEFSFQFYYFQTSNISSDKSRPYVQSKHPVAFPPLKVSLSLSQMFLTTSYWNVIWLVESYSHISHTDNYQSVGMLHTVCWLVSTKERMGGKKHLHFKQVLVKLVEMFLNCVKWGHCSLHLLTALQSWHEGTDKLWKTNNIFDYNHKVLL